MVKIAPHDAADGSAPRPYAQAMEVTGADRWLWLSGQAPVASDGSVPGGFEDQARLVWSKIAAQLRAAEMDLANLVKVTIHLSDRRHRAANGAICREVLGERQVAITCVVCALFDAAWMLEIDAVAAA